MTIPTAPAPSGSVPARIQGPLIHPAVLPLLATHWAMEPSAYAQLERRLLSIPPEANLAAFYVDDPSDPGAGGQRPRKPYQMVSGVALVPLTGVLQKDPDWLMRYYGGTSTRAFAALLGQAMSDPDVSAVCLLVDSPGGTVDGTADAADAVWAARQSGRKPLVAAIDGYGCSAAFWIAAQCAQVYACQTAMVGSIGTRWSFLDSSKAYEMLGLEAVEIVTGTFKAAGASGSPWTDETRAYYQGLVDDMQARFSAGVVRGRKLSAASVRSLVAEARVFIGPGAQAAGLIDGVAGAADVVRQLAKQAGRTGPKSNAKGGALSTAKTGTYPAKSGPSPARSGTGENMDNLATKIAALLSGHRPGAEADDLDETDPPADATALQAQVSALTGLNSTLAAKNTTLVASNQTLQAANEGLTAQVNTLKAEMETLKAEQTTREADALTAAKAGAKAAAVLAFGAGSERLKQAEALIESQTSASALGAMQDAYRTVTPAGLTPNGTRQTVAAGVTPTEDAATDSDFYASIKSEGAQANGTAQK